MPIAHLYLLEGRSVEQKRRIIARVTDALVETAGVTETQVRVLLHDVPASDWGVGGEPVSDRIPTPEH